jgi:hypothetical protein
MIPLIENVKLIPLLKSLLKAGLKMLISPNNCQFGSKFWIRPDEADAFLENTHPKYSPGTRMEP